MIIKLTLNDNDFGELLGGFCRSLERGYPFPCPAYKTELQPIGQTSPAPRLEYESADLVIQYFHASRRWQELYHADTLPPEEKAWFCDQIAQAWAARVQLHKSKDYLIKNFECSFVDSITGQWENGEAYYFFPGGYGNKIINL